MSMMHAMNKKGFGERRVVLAAALVVSIVILFSFPVFGTQGVCQYSCGCYDDTTCAGSGADNTCRTNVVGEPCDTGTSCIEINNIGGCYAPEDCTTPKDEGGTNNNGQCGDDLCTNQFCEKGNQFKKCSDKKTCDYIFPSKLATSTNMYGDLKWKVTTIKNGVAAIREELITEDDVNLFKFISNCNKDSVDIQKRIYETWVYVKHTGTLIYGYHVDDTLTIEFTKLDQSKEVNNHPLTKDYKDGEVNLEHGWYKLIVTYEDIKGDDCLDVYWKLKQGVKSPWKDNFLAMSSEGPFLIPVDDSIISETEKLNAGADNEITLRQAVCDYDYRGKAPNRDWLEITKEDGGVVNTKRECCGDTITDAGVVYFYDVPKESKNAEVICTFSGNEWKWIDAKDVPESAPVISSAINEEKSQYIDFLNNNYANKEDYWIGCIPPEFKIESFTTGVHSLQKGDRIKSVFDTFKLSYSLDGVPKQGEPRRFGVETLEIPSTEYNKYYFGNEKTNPETTEVPIGSIDSSYICVKRNSVGFWAGCGGRYDPNAPDFHQFYPGGTPLTILDFGVAKFESTEHGKDIKPKSKYLYNHVLVLSATIKNSNPDFSQRVAYATFNLDTDNNIAPDGITDWSGYGYLEFYIYVVRYPENVYLQFWDENNKALNTIQVFNTVFKFSQTGYEAKKWHKIKVPLEFVYKNRGTEDKLKKITAITVLVDTGPYMDLKEGDIINYPGLNSGWELLFIDRFSLSGLADTKIENYYCSVNPTGSVFNWIQDLNTNAQACNEQPGYIWTGTTCCGNDPKETYYDQGADGTQKYGYVCIEGEGITGGDNGIILEGTNVLLHKGKFYGCSDSDKNKLPAQFQEKFTAVTNKCGFIADSKFYCDNYQTIRYDDSGQITEKKTTTVNLIRNGGFESNVGQADVWRKTQDNSAITFDTTQHKTGSSSIKLDTSEIKQSVAVDVKNQNFFLSFYYKGSCNSFNVTLYDEGTVDGNGKTNQYEFISPLVLKEEWHYVTHTFTNVAYDSHSSYYFIKFKCDSPQNFFIDDISLTYSVPADKESTNCCPKDTCWDGASCVGSGTVMGVPNSQDGFMECSMAGEEAQWMQFEKKPNFNGDKFGICPKTSCYKGTDDKATYDQSLCLESGKYVDDAGAIGNGNHFCEAEHEKPDDKNTPVIGTHWTSRTKILTEYLVTTYGGGDYILQCGTPDEVLNSVPLKASEDISGICAMKTDDKIIIGAALNQKISAEDSFLEKVGIEKSKELGKDVCSGTGFVSCSSGKYNPQTGIMVYNKNNAAEKNGNFFLNIVSALWNAVNNILGADDAKISGDLAAIKTMSSFGKLYVNSKGAENGKDSIRIFGSFETKGQNKYLTVTYNGISSDSCTLITENQQGDTLSCCSVSQNSKRFTRIFGTDEKYWQDLTSKLRVSSGNGIVDVSKLIEDKATQCTDTADNDCDGLIDEKDADCAVAEEDNGVAAADQGQDSGTSGQTNGESPPAEDETVPAPQPTVPTEPPTTVPTPTVPLPPAG